MSQDEGLGEGALLAAQSGHGIDPGGTPRRQRASQDSDQQQQAGGKSTDTYNKGLR